MLRPGRGTVAVLSDSRLDAALITHQEAAFQSVTAALDNTPGVVTADDVVLLGRAGCWTSDHRLVVAESRTEEPGGHA